MNKYIVLYSSLEKASREFVAELDSDIEKIDWYNRADKAKVVEYLSKGLPGVSSFPAVVDTENKVLVNDVSDFDTAVAQIDEHVEAQEEKYNLLKKKRNSLLGATDYIMLSDSPASEDCKAEYVTYRQALRDLDLSDLDVEFPEQPDYVKAE